MTDPTEEKEEKRPYLFGTSAAVQRLQTFIFEFDDSKKKIK